LSEIKKYIEVTKTKTELQRKELQKDKTGVFTGAYAINPITKKQIPIYVADYVLNNYATGIVMGVPAHDQRDFDFAKQHNIDIKFIIETKNHDEAYEDDGVHIDSELINGQHIEKANGTIINFLQKNKLGNRHVTYKLKD
jgi:leucyl-tRNA synthetase